MRQTTSTPGPDWQFDLRGDRPLIVDATCDRIIAEVRVGESGLTTSEAIDNARVLAAAPDLFSAGRAVMFEVRQLIAGCSGIDRHIMCSAIGQLETALAKAEGSTP